MTTPSVRTIWNIAWPIMLSLTAQNVVNVTDTAFLGHVGEVELGGSAIGGLFYTTLYMVGFGFTIGVQILIARRHGEKNFPAIGRIFDNSLYFLGLTSLIISALVFFYGSSVLKPFMASQPVFEASSVFLKYRVLGLFFSAIALLFRSFYTGIAFTRHLSISSAIMALLNVALDYAMIFGHWGFPRMGIEGAAIASAISESSAVIYFLIVTVRNPRVKEFDLFRWVKPELMIIKKTLGISIFVMMQMVLSLGSWFVFFMFIEKMGERPLAVSNIIRSVYLLLMIPGWALCSVTNTLVSNSMGKGISEMVIPITRKMVVFCMISMSVVLAVAGIFPRAIISLYTNNQSLVEATVPSFYLIIVALFFFAIVSILFNGVLGTANTNISFLIESFTLTLYLVYAWYVAVILKQRIEWVWTSEFIYSSVLGTLSLLYLYKGKWREKQI
jgi:putative MATE family efflux protein